MLEIFKKRLFKSGIWEREKEPGSELLLESCNTESNSSVNNVTSVGKEKSPNQPDVSIPLWKAVVNIVNFIEGLGFLALPYAVKQGGIAVIVAFFVIPLCLWYTGKVLIECLYDEDEKQGRVKVRTTFKDLGEILEPKYGGYVVTALFNLELFLNSVSYLVVCGSLMRHALPSVPLTVIAWTCIAGVAVFPTTLLKSLSEIAWLSVLGVIALTSVLMSVLWYGAEHVDAWNLESILFWDSKGASIGVPILIYGFACCFILPSAEESMREKHKFSLALALSYVASIVMKITFAVFGFLSFGSNTDQVVLNNLPDGPFRMIISFLFVLFCILSNALILYPVFETLQSSEVIKNVSSSVPISSQLLLRIIVVLSSILVAILVPKFALVLSFTGSILTSFFVYTFPCAVHLKLKFKKLKTHEICLDILLLFVGNVISIFGIIFSVKALITG